MIEDKSKLFNIDEELKRFEELEVEVNSTIKILDEIIEMFNKKTEIAKGAAGKLVLLIEQKISLLTRKESIIKNVSDIKKNVFNINSKIENNEDENTDLAKILIRYVEAIKEQQKEILEAKETAQNAIDMVENQKDVDDFFNNKTA